jgi:hypothetical protein
MGEMKPSVSKSDGYGHVRGSTPTVPTTNGQSQAVASLKAIAVRILLLNSPRYR